MSLLYGVNKTTLEAYLKAERKKVWCAVLEYLKQQPDWSDAGIYANWCYEQAQKEDDRANEAHEQHYYEPYVAVSRYDSLIMLALVLACCAVWFAGTWMIVVFLVGG